MPKPKPEFECLIQGRWVSEKLVRLYLFGRVQQRRLAGLELERLGVRVPFQVEARRVKR